ncbi:MAG TPA: MlaD family protein [Candidatus Babeliales bacterium]|nr:MlaD family protein [Candidatus Babeliales bacterium]
MQGKIETRVGIFVLIALAIFGYMGFKIGAFRFDSSQYTKYMLYFRDISGLSRKAAVKISGVKVGWVESIKLIEGAQAQVAAEIMVSSAYPLYQNAYALVRQDGLLGPKYIDLLPGDQLLRQLSEGASLQKSGVEPVDLDDIFREVKVIAHNVREVSESFRDALGGPQGMDQIKSFVTNIETAAEKFSNVSTVIERSFTRNEDNIDAFLEIGANVRTLSDRLENKLFPSFQESIEKIATVFDRDFGRIAMHVETTTSALEDAAAQARDGLRSVSSVAEKIDEGKGLLGKLVNEDETYRDIKVAVSGFKNYVTKLDRMQITFDTHFETMHRPAENYRYEDSKGYFDVRIHPNEEHFYVVQIASSEKGFAYRTEKELTYTNDELEYINPAKQNDPIAIGPDQPITEIDRPILFSNNFYSNNLSFDDQLRTNYRQEELRFERNAIRLGVQFGKIFGDIALRVGMIDGFAGLGADYDFPFKTDKFRWVTTFEGFDFRGFNRRGPNKFHQDKRPHLKWLNRMFFMRNIYFTFGADDFISKQNANAFVGVGLRFGDDDVKYVLGSISGASGLVKT